MDERGQVDQMENLRIFEECSNSSLIYILLSCDVWLFLLDKWNNNNHQKNRLGWMMMVTSR